MLAPGFHDDPWHPWRRPAVPGPGARVGRAVGMAGLLVKDMGQQLGNRNWYVFLCEMNRFYGLEFWFVVYFFGCSSPYFWLKPLEHNHNWHVFCFSRLCQCVAVLEKWPSCTDADALPIYIEKTKLSQGRDSDHFFFWCMYNSYTYLWKYMEIQLICYGNFM